MSNPKKNALLKQLRARETSETHNHKKKQCEKEKKKRKTPNSQCFIGNGLPTKLFTVELYCRTVRSYARRGGVADLCHEAFRSASQDEDMVVCRRLLNLGSDQSRDIWLAALDGVLIGSARWH